ncbi:MAG TPA: SIS domain-containing protein [Acidisarcina sp.]
MIDHTPARLVRIEAEALLALAERLDGSMSADFERAIDRLLRCGQAGARVALSGIGKSGIIAQKIAATLNSTGTPAYFLHAAEALHGDLGMIALGDVVIALSASGETEELLRLLAALKTSAYGYPNSIPDPRHGSGDQTSRPSAQTDSGAAPRTQWISFCCNMNSTLARSSDLALDCSVAQEACGMDLAPTASTTAMLALGDALAIAVSLRKGFRMADFATLHPGGKLGKRLARVDQLMHSGESIPRVTPETPMSEVIYEMSRKGLGMTTVESAGKLAGVISDGDLRRLLQREGPRALEKSAGETMQPSPRTIGPAELAAAALSTMEERKITSLIVVDQANAILGVLHMHDLWQAELF